MRSLADHALIFVTGVEGSGTSLMLRLLSEAGPNLALGGDYVSPNRPGYDCAAVATRFNALTQALWATHPHSDPGQRASVIEEIRRLPIPLDVERVIYKRSYPFLIDALLPSLSDVRSFARETRVLVLRRDLRGCTASVLRRGFVATVEAAAERVLQADRTLRREIAEFAGQKIAILSYERLIETPREALTQLEPELALRPGALAALAATVARPTQQSGQVADANRAYLDQFFGEAAEG